MPDTQDRYAVFGNPINHSKSPDIHNQFAAQTGQSLIYTAELIELDQFAESVTAFASNHGKGLNITVPFKREAWQLASKRSPRAERAGTEQDLSMQRSNLQTHLRFFGYLMDCCASFL